MVFIIALTEDSVQVNTMVANVKAMLVFDMVKDVSYVDYDQTPSTGLLMDPVAKFIVQLKSNTYSEKF